MAEHTHTAVLLHGRGSSGSEFADELFESMLSDGRSLKDAFPTCRWVFPSSKELWSTAFKESMPAWFEAHPVTDPPARHDLQVDGIRDSVAHISGIVDQEIQRLGGRPDKLALGGISQGGAVSLCTHLLRQAENRADLGALFVASAWLPFAKQIQETLPMPGHKAAGPHTEEAGADLSSFIKVLAALSNKTPQGAEESPSSSGTPVFMGHGTDDAYVDVELGREALGVLTSIGLRVEWNEYSGAEQEGHWLKIPEELDDIRAFLSRLMQEQPSRR